MKDSVETVQDWYEISYAKEGLGAQRRYPNEELLRFMGRNFFGVPTGKRDGVRILEVGCGSCANLWMIAREGFSAHGIDLSEEAIRLGRRMLDEWGEDADLRVGSMTELPYADASFDAVLDVFSAYCLNEEDFRTCLGQVVRVLKPGGLFFSYTPDKASDAWQHHDPAKMIDSSTLNGIYREDSPYSGNHYSFRFVHPEQYAALVVDVGLQVQYLETIRRSYHDQYEAFEYVVLEAVK